MACSEGFEDCDRTQEAHVELVLKRKAAPDSAELADAASKRSCTDEGRDLGLSSPGVPSTQSLGLSSPGAPGTLPIANDNCCGIVDENRDGDGDGAVVKREVIWPTDVVPGCISGTMSKLQRSHLLSLCDAHLVMSGPDTRRLSQARREILVAVLSMSLCDEIALEALRQSLMKMGADPRPSTPPFWDGTAKRLASFVKNKDYPSFL